MQSPPAKEPTGQGHRQKLIKKVVPAKDYHRNTDTEGTLLNYLTQSTTVVLIRDESVSTTYKLRCNPCYNGPSAPPELYLPKQSTHQTNKCCLLATEDETIEPTSKHYSKRVNQDK